MLCILHTKRRRMISLAGWHFYFSPLLVVQKYVHTLTSKILSKVPSVWSKTTLICRSQALKLLCMNIILNIPHFVSEEIFFVENSHRERIFEGSVYVCTYYVQFIKTKVNFNWCWIRGWHNGESPSKTITWILAYAFPPANRPNQTCNIDEPPTPLHWHFVDNGWTPYPLILST